MVMQADFVTASIIENAVETLKKKKPSDTLSQVRFERFEEGRCAQIMHLGPYSQEGPTIEKLHSFVELEDYTLRGKHHEIYLSDPRRCTPEKLKTVIRHPVSKL